MRLLLISLFLLLSNLVSLGATFVIDGITYEITGTEGEVILKSADKSLCGDLTIPSTVSYNNVTYSVREIGSKAFANCSNITNVTIPYSVISIGNFAFHQCYNLTYVKISKSVTSIGNWAFGECSNLKHMFIPNSVMEIGAYAFYECSSLKLVTLPNSIQEIQIGLFGKCSSLTSVHIPYSVTKICDRAFFNCLSLTNINLPNSIEEIKSEAFYECRNLKSLTLGSSVFLINNNAFGNCSLKSVNILNTKAPYVAANIFSNIELDKCTLHVPEGAIKSYSKSAVWGEFANIVEDAQPYCDVVNQQYYDFEYEGLHFSKITDSAVEVSPVCLVSYSSSGELYKPSNTEGLSAFPYEVYDDNNNLYEVIGIGDHAFEGSENVQYLILWGNIIFNLQYIGDFAFRNCPNMEIVDIPNTVGRVGKKAFYGCSSLKHVWLGLSGRNTTEDTMIVETGAFCNTPSLEDVLIGQIPISLPSEDAFASDMSTAQTKYYVLDPESDPYTNFSQYKPISFGNLNSCTEVYSGEIPHFIPEFISNLPDNYEYKLLDNTIDQPISAEPCSDQGFASVLISAHYPNRHPMKFTITLPYQYTIEKISIHLNVKNYTRSYGDDNPEFEIEVTYPNGVDEDIFYELPYIIQSGLPNHKSNVGKYDLKPDAWLKDRRHYQTIEHNGFLMVEPASLEISAPNLTREYGQENPDVVLAYTGFKNDETEDVLTTKPIVTLDVTPESAVGEYPITVSGGAAQNYDISYQFGKLIITKAHQTISWEQDLPSSRIGDELELTAVASSGLPITYSSSNPDIAVIEGNAVRFIADGEVEITASQIGNENYLAAPSISKTFNVSPIEVENIVLNQENISLLKDETCQLIAIVNPEDATYKDLFWSSADEGIATVSQDGVVTAISKGKTKITVASVHNPEIKAECNVTVDVESSVENIYSSENIEITVHNNSLVIRNIEDNVMVRVYTLDGALVYSGTKHVIPMQSGIYIAKIKNVTKKVII